MQPPHVTQSATSLTVKTFTSSGTTKRTTWFGALGLCVIATALGLVTGHLWMHLSLRALILLTVSMTLKPSHNTAVFSAGKIQFADPTGLWTTVDAPQQLTIRGDLGEPMTLWADETRVLSVTMGQSDPWTPSLFLQVCSEAASRVGAPLLDQCPREEWTRWEQDPTYRIFSEWEDRIEQSERSLPNLYERRPDEPPGVTRVLHGYTFEADLEAPPITVTESALSWGDHTIDLALVLDVLVNADHPALPNQQLLSLEILTGDGIVTLLPAQGMATPKPTADAMLWLMHDLRAHAERARRPSQKGSPEEVPQVLHRLNNQG